MLGGRRRHGEVLRACWNGPSCYYLDTDTCQFYHPPEHKTILQERRLRNCREAEERAKWSVDRVESWSKRFDLRAPHITDQVLDEIHSPGLPYWVMERADGLDRYLYIDMDGRIFLLDPEAFPGREYAKLSLTEYVCDTKGVLIMGELVDPSACGVAVFLATDLVKEKEQVVSESYSSRAERLQQILASISSRKPPSLAIMQKRAVPLAKWEGKPGIPYPYPVDGVYLIPSETDRFPCRMWRWRPEKERVVNVLLGTYPIVVESNKVPRPTKTFQSDDHESVINESNQTILCQPLLQAYQLYVHRCSRAMEPVPESSRHPFHHDHTLLLDNDALPVTINIPENQLDCAGKVVQAAWEPFTSSWRFVAVHPYKSVADGYSTVSEVQRSCCCYLSKVKDRLVVPYSRETTSPAMPVSDPAKTLLRFLQEIKMFWYRFRGSSDIIEVQWEQREYSKMLRLFPDLTVIRTVVVGPDYRLDGTSTMAISDTALCIVFEKDLEVLGGKSWSLLQEASHLVVDKGNLLVVVIGDGLDIETLMKKVETKLPLGFLPISIKPLQSMVHLLSPDLRETCMQAGADIGFSGHILKFQKLEKEFSERPQSFLKEAGLIMKLKDGGKQGRDILSLMPQGLCYHVLGFLEPIQVISMGMLSHHWLRCLNESNGKAFAERTQDEIIESFTTRNLAAYACMSKCFSSMNTSTSSSTSSSTTNSSSSSTSNILADLSAVLGIGEIREVLMKALEERRKKERESRRMIYTDQQEIVEYDMMVDDFFDIHSVDLDFEDYEDGFFDEFHGGEDWHDLY